MTARRPRARRERGAALLLVLMVVAIVTVLAMELAYDTRVSLQIAANARDELRASYQARGAVALSRLVLHFQQRLDQAGGAAGADPGRGPGRASGGAAGLPGGGQPGHLLLPALGRHPRGRHGHGPAARDRPDVRRAGARPDEGFQATIEDEERKVNVSQLAGLSTVAGPQLQRLAAGRARPALRRALRQGGRPAATGSPAGTWPWRSGTGWTRTPPPASLGLNPLAPFEKGFGDENQYYDRGRGPVPGQERPLRLARRALPGGRGRRRLHGRLRRSADGVPGRQRHHQRQHQRPGADPGERAAHVDAPGRAPAPAARPRLRPEARPWRCAWPGRFPS